MFGSQAAGLGTQSMSACGAAWEVQGLGHWLPLMTPVHWDDSLEPVDILAQFEVEMQRQAGDFLQSFFA